MNDKLTIKVNIVGRTYSLTIKKEEEESLRKATQLINSKISQYREKHASADPIDLLAVTAVQFTVELLEAEKKEMEKTNAIESIIEEVKKVNKRLDTFVKE